MGHYSIRDYKGDPLLFNQVNNKLLKIDLTTVVDHQETAEVALQYHANDGTTFEIIDKIFEHIPDRNKGGVVIHVTLTPRNKGGEVLISYDGVEYKREFENRHETNRRTLPTALLISISFVIVLAILVFNNNSKNKHPQAPITHKNDTTITPSPSKSESLPSKNGGTKSEILPAKEINPTSNITPPPITISKSDPINQTNITPKPVDVALPSPQPNPLPVPQPTSINSKEKTIVPPSIYTLEPGDTLRKVSLKYYQDEYHVWHIASNNQITNPDLVFPGTTLTIKLAPNKQ